MRILLLTVAALLAFPTVQGADWLQPGYDGARHSVTADSGPVWPDVALHLEGDAFRSKTLGGQYSYDQLSDPIIVNGTAYLMRHAQPADSPRDCLDSSRLDLLAVSLQTGADQIVETFDAPRCLPTPIASDGQWIYTAVRDQLLAYDPTTDTWPLNVSVRFESATAGIPEMDPTSGPALSLYVDPYASCGGIALDAGKAYLACTAGAMTWYGAYAYLAIVDLAGSTASMHPLRLRSPPNTADAEGLATDAAYQATPGFLAVQGIAASDGRVAVTVHGLIDMQLGSGGSSLEDGTASQTAHVWLLDEAGTILDARGLTPPHRGYNLLFPASPILVEDAVLQRNQRLNLYVPDRPAEGYPGFRDDVAWEWDAGSACAVADDSLYCAFSHRLYRLDHDFGIVWRQDLPAGQVWGPGSLIVADGVLYGLAIRVFGETTVIAKETKTGTDLWTHRAAAGAGQARFAIADGLLVMHHEDGDVTILGMAPFSPEPDFEVPGRYPGAGELIRVDLGLSGNGIGSALEYSADWGDGSITDWTADPVLQHRYASPEDFTATFYVRNDAGQTARSAPLTFHVGQQDPTMNILNSPFDDRYQETSFFFLGLLVTAVAAIFGLYRAGSKRRRLERELRNLQALKEEYGGDADGLQARLSVRRQHIHDLYMDRKLEDGHLQVLEGRIDELSGRARLGRVEEECGFLPVSLARSLEGMLRDGRISSRERSTFLSAVEEHHALAPAEKGKVRKLVDEWFHHDAGGAA